MGTFDTIRTISAYPFGSLLRPVRSSRLGRAIGLGPSVHPLAGDRCIEWEWVARHLPDTPARVLDVGCVDSITAGLAAVKGLEVTGVDLRPNPFVLPGLSFIQGSVEDSWLGDETYDCIVLCSTLEHIGLVGRYGERPSPAGDRRAMRRLLQALAEGGTMIVTIPVGKSSIIAPYHRIYDENDTADLFQGLSVIKSDFWKKTGQAWGRVRPSEAFDTVGSKTYYAIGLFLLTKGMGAAHP